MTHLCVSKLNIIGSDNGLSPGRHQAIIWTNAGMLLICPLGTNFSGILFEYHTFSFKKMHLNMSSWKWQPFLSWPQCVKSTWFAICDYETVSLGLNLLLVSYQALCPKQLMTTGAKSWLRAIKWRLEQYGQTEYVNYKEKKVTWSNMVRQNM